MHLFISYKRDDYLYRDALIAELDRHGIAYWADSDLEAGVAWREAIDTALEEAFAIAVILTPRSVKSYYVTYEWSWALGRGKPVIPLLFEPIEFIDRHARLGEIQEINCTESIHNQVIQTISRFRRKSSVSIFHEGRINEIFESPRTLLSISEWLYRCSEGGNIFPRASAYSHAISILNVEISMIASNTLPKYLAEQTSSIPVELKIILENLQNESLLISEICSDWVHARSNLDFPDFLGQWNMIITPRLESLHGYSDLHEIQERIDAIFGDLSDFYDPSMRKQYRAFPLLFNISDSAKSVFEHLYDLSSPEAREELEDMVFDHSDYKHPDSTPPTPKS